MRRKKNKTTTYLLWKASKKLGMAMCLSVDMQKEMRRKLLNNNFKSCQKDWNLKNLHNQARKKNNTLSQGSSVISFDEQSSDGFLFNFIATYKVTFFLKKYD